MKRALVIAVVLAVLAAGNAQAGYTIVLVHRFAVQQIRAIGAVPDRCKRLAPRHIRCWVTFTWELHEAEEEEDGSLVNETVTLIYKKAICDVGFKGVRTRYL